MLRLSAMSVVRAALVLSALGGLLVVLLECRWPVRPAGDPGGGLVRAFDAPDAAADYYAARRQPLSHGIDPQERYRSALERLSRMPRFASRAGRRLPSLRDAGETAAPLAWPDPEDRQTPGVSAQGAPDSLSALGVWTPLGPGNIGGRTRTLQIDPRNPDRMLTGGVSGGIWKTENGGASWRPVGDQLANLAVNSMAMSLGTPTAIYVGTGEGYFREEVRFTGLPLRGGGIFVSADWGESWTRLPATTTADFHFVNDLAVSHVDERVIYAATRTGVWRARDRGAAWEQILSTSVRGGCLDLALRTDRPTDVLFASCGTFEQATVYRTLDARGAAAFTPVLSDPGMGRTALALAPSDQDVVYALAASNLPGPGGVYEQGLHALFRSTTGGAPGSWSAQVRNTDPVKLRTMILTNPYSALRTECGTASANSYTTMGWYVAVVAVDPVDPEIVWAAGVDWFRSRDGGRSWGIASEWWREGVSGFVHADQHGLVFHPDYNGASNQQAFALTDGGIYRTDNARAADAPDACNPAAIGVAWRPLNHNIGITQFYHGLPLPEGTSYLGGTQDNGTVFGSAARGLDGWSRVYGGDGTYVALNPPDAPTTIYLQSQWANILRLDLRDGQLYNANDGLPPRRSDGLRGERADFLFVTPLVADPGGSGTLWTGGRYLYRRSRSRDAGRGAGAIDDDLVRGRSRTDGNARTDLDESEWRVASDRLLGDGLVSAIAVSPTRGRSVAAGATDGRVYVTRRGGLVPVAGSWEVSEPRTGWVTSVAYDPADPNVLYATYGGFGGAHVFKSDNGGRTWRAIDGQDDNGIPDVPVHVVVADPGQPDRLYLGTDVGVFVSDSGGDLWAVENTGFGAIVTEWLALLRTQGGERWLFAFTHGRGAWKVKLVG